MVTAGNPPERPRPNMFFCFFPFHEGIDGDLLGCVSLILFQYSIKWEKPFSIFMIVAEGHAFLQFFFLSRCFIRRLDLDKFGISFLITPGS